MRTRTLQMACVGFLVAGAVGCGRGATSQGAQDENCPPVGDSGSLSGDLTGQDGWIEIRGLDIGQTDPAPTDRRTYVASLAGVTPRRPQPGRDHSRAEIDGFRVRDIREEIRNGASIAVQLAPSAKKEMYALRTIALRPDGSIHWIGGCGAKDLEDAYLAFDTHRRATGDSRTAADVFRLLISPGARESGAYAAFDAFEDGPAEVPWAQRDPAKRYVYDAPAEVKSRYVTQEFNIRVPPVWATFGGTVCGRVPDGWNGCVRLAATRDDGLLSFPGSRPRAGNLELWLLDDDGNPSAPVGRLARLTFSESESPDKPLELVGDSTIRDRATLIEEARQRDVIVRA